MKRIKNWLEKQRTIIVNFIFHMQVFSSYAYNAIKSPKRPIPDVHLYLLYKPIDKRTI